MDWLQETMRRKRQYERWCRSQLNKELAKQQQYRDLELAPIKRAQEEREWQEKKRRMAQEEEERKRNEEEEKRKKEEWKKKNQRIKLILKRTAGDRWISGTEREKRERMKEQQRKEEREKKRREEEEKKKRQRERDEMKRTLDQTVERSNREERRLQEAWREARDRRVDGSTSTPTTIAAAQPPTKLLSLMGRFMRSIHPPTVADKSLAEVQKDVLAAINSPDARVPIISAMSPRNSLCSMTTVEGHLTTPERSSTSSCSCSCSSCQGSSSSSSSASQEDPDCLNISEPVEFSNEVINKKLKFSRTLAFLHPSLVLTFLLRCQTLSTTPVSRV